MREPEIREPGRDLDCADPNATAFNRAACGMLDLPTERELGPVDVLAVIAAEAVVQAVLPEAWDEFMRWLNME